MVDHISHENNRPPPFKELSRQEDHHLKKQAYYFIPFLRQCYSAVRSNTIDRKSNLNVGVLNEIKNLALYYGAASVYGDFDLRKEQSLINSIFDNSGLNREDFKKIIIGSTLNAFNKTDGYLDEYFFGEKTTEEVYHADLPGAPLYEMGLAEGIAIFDQKDRVDLVEQFSKFIKTNSDQLPISIMGNVARGVLDAAALYAGLQKNNIRSRFNLYRASSQAAGDKTYVVLDEDFDPGSWGIAVDSFTAKGLSVPISIKLMEGVGFKRRSMFLTHMGRKWAQELGVEFQWDHYQGEENWAGTMLYGNFKK